MITTTALRFQYFFDPLCGGCYASAPALVALADAHGAQVRMMPSGLFAGARPITTMADFAWRNDQRIGALTGQPFTEAYHSQVLLAPDGVFDSTAPTRALVALGELDGSLERRFLHQVQIARYVEGEDTCQPEVAARIAAAVARRAGIALEANALADRLRSDARLQALADGRIREAQDAMRTMGISGVPQLVVVAENRRHVISGEDLYSGKDVLLTRIATLSAAS